MRGTISADEPKILFIPAGYANGWMSLTDDATLLVFSTTTAAESKIDDYRFPARTLGHLDCDRAMKILIAILSCHKEIGLHNNLRDTWLRQVPKGVDYKFFLGRPGKANAADEVYLDVPDTFSGVSQKTSGMVQWAYEHGYDYLFKCDTDTYVNVLRLLASGFEQYDYSGRRYPPSNDFKIHVDGSRTATDWGNRLGNRSEAYGGPGYWLSRKAMKFIVDNKNSQEYLGSSEDWWVGAILRRCDITTHNDLRYQDFVRNSPAPWNNVITCHEHRSGHVFPDQHDVKGIMRRHETMVRLHERATMKTPSSKVLIAVHGYVNGARNGEHQSMRETSLHDLHLFPNVQVKFFIGDGTPTGEDESAMWASFRSHENEYKKKALATLAQKFDYTPQPDEVIVSVPDGYVHLPYKTRESCKWALEQGFDYTFQCFPDTYINLDRLLGSGFEQKGYTGHECGGYAAGGPGYWLDRPMMQIVANEPRVTEWAEDRWVGLVMKEHGIPFTPDSRYAEGPNAPLCTNDIITSHMGHTPVVFTPEVARVVHRKALSQRAHVISNIQRPKKIAKNDLIVDWWDTPSGKKMRAEQNGVIP